MKREVRAMVRAIFALLVLSGLARADRIFALDPGSTITPTGGAPEPLTGVIAFRDIGYNVSIVMFDAILLKLSSPSFALSLDNSAKNDVVTGLFPDGTSFFSEVIDATGLSPSVLSMQSIGAPGHYHSSGSFIDPDRLSYSDIRLAPVGGGEFKARIDFSATAVPEPTSFAVAVLALVGVVAARKWAAKP